MNVGMYKKVAVKGLMVGAALGREIFKTTQSNLLNLSHTLIL